jgi:hypothetical protein
VTGTSGGGSSATGTTSFGYTFANPPVVTATLVSTTSTGYVFSVVVNTITTTGFSWVKHGNNNSSFFVPGEGFNWIAIGT